MIDLIEKYRYRLRKTVSKFLNRRQKPLLRAIEKRWNKANAVWLIYIFVIFFEHFAHYEVNVSHVFGWQRKRSSDKCKRGYKTACQVSQSWEKWFYLKSKSTKIVVQPSLLRHMNLSCLNSIQRSRNRFSLNFSQLILYNMISILRTRKKNPSPRRGFEPTTLCDLEHGRSWVRIPSGTRIFFFRVLLKIDITLLLFQL